MTPSAPKLLLQSSPFLHRRLTVPRLILDLLIGLVPVVFASLWFFGLSAALVLASATAGAVVTEWLVTRGAKSESPLRDNSALLTGVILGLTLPPGIPLWIAFLVGTRSPTRRA